MHRAGHGDVQQWAWLAWGPGLATRIMLCALGSLLRKQGKVPDPVGWSGGGNWRCFSPLLPGGSS